MYRSTSMSSKSRIIAKIFEFVNLISGYSNKSQELIYELPWAEDAAFNSYAFQHDPLCMPNTRVALLDEIMGWSNNPHEKCMFWLNGMAGTGKSTIARTIARKLHDQGRLGASFFSLGPRGIVATPPSSLHLSLGVWQIQYQL